MYIDISAPCASTRQSSHTAQVFNKSSAAAAIAIPTTAPLPLAAPLPLPLPPGAVCSGIHNRISLSDCQAEQQAQLYIPITYISTIWWLRQ